MAEKKTRRRKHATRWSVKAADRAAHLLISIGGVGTIIAVSAVCLFLASVVVPLFLPGKADSRDAVSSAWVDQTPIHMAVDEYRVLAWAFFRDGSLQIVRLDSGELLATHQIAAGDSLSAWAFPTAANDIALGFVDGTIRLGTIEFVTDFPEADQLPDDAAGLELGAKLTYGDAILERTPEGQFRRQQLVIDLAAPAKAADDAISLVDVVTTSSGPLVSLVTATGRVFVNRVRQYENLMTGEQVTQMTRAELPAFTSGKPAYLKMQESGSSLYLVRADGALTRYDIRDFEKASVVEQLRLVRPGATLSELRFLLGRTTLLVGDDHGHVSTWFEYRNAETGGRDGMAMASAHVFDDDDAGVTRIAPSPRTRVMAVGRENGSIHLYQITSQARILGLKADDAIDALVIAPKADGIVALAGGRLWHWDIDERHPEATLAALFTPVWYEGYGKPSHVWQSSSGTDDFESKLGMWPLVFGTLKATFYSMLFGIPLALLAAIYSSEFLSPTLRNRVKTLIELMASLPSVVLGFLAALVFAPFVQRLVPTVLVGFVTIPAAFLIGAYLWQILPYHVSIRLERFQIVAMMLLLPVGMAFAVWLGPVVERLFFFGDMGTWLNGAQGSGLGGWVILFLPLAVVLVVFVFGRTINPMFRSASTQMSRSRVAALDMGRFGVGALISVVVALIAAWLLTTIGIDPRGSDSFLHTYVQRNALVVGFVMGFAIIPIIYTIAEDALSAVPEHLRAASLGAGATPWQTAIRIVIPTAMSGLFSAIMIGLGRAVGETMIVLMAAGNTPVLEMNIFNGFRTLSANIAVELPEAVKDSTHYRTLFLAAFILFLMTFLINTIAEVVRLRFRKRAQQL